MTRGTGAAGFWSYAHADDEGDGGRVRRLAENVRAEYALLTGDELQLFLDRDSLVWGDQWRARIDQALAGATFFIPIVTPRYFRSQECRKELMRFDAEARRIGLENQLVLPVYWVAVRELDAGEPDDEVMAIVRSRQWEDLRGIRLLDDGASEYRQAVNRLAQRLADMSEELTERAGAPRGGGSPSRRSMVDGETPPLVETPVGAGGDDEPGLIELLVQGEEAFPKLGEALDGLTAELAAVGELAQGATREIEASDARHGGFAGRLTATERYARALEGPSARIAEWGQTYARELVNVDPLVLTLIDGAAEASGPEAESARRYIASVLELADNAEATAVELADLTMALDESAAFSRSLRRPLKRIRAALQGVLDGQAVIAEWRRRAVDVGQVIERPDGAGADERAPGNGNDDADASPAGG